MQWELGPSLLVHLYTREWGPLWFLAGDHIPLSWACAEARRVLADTVAELSFYVRLKLGDSEVSGQSHQ